MPTCGEPHPVDPSRTCLKTSEYHADHADNGPDVWTNTSPKQQRFAEEIATQKKRPKNNTGRSKLAGLAEAVLATREGKAEGMARSAISEASRAFRRVFLRAMVEVATQQEFFSTNDVWVLLRSRSEGDDHPSRQATGNIGTLGKGRGWWVATDRREPNLSGNGHADAENSQTGVRVYQSRILGHDLDDFEPEIDEIAGPCVQSPDRVESTPSPTSQIWGSRDRTISES